MLKYKLSAAEFTALPEALKQYYLKTGEEYLLQTDTATELQNANHRLKIEKEGLEQQISGPTGFTVQIRNLTTENAELRTKKADVLSLEQTHRSQMDGLKTSHTTELSKKDKQIHKLLVVKTAEQMARDMAGDNAHLLQPILEKRLTADLTGEEPVLKFLDANGNPAAADFTAEKLQKEIVDSKKYGAILIASKASGSATHQQSSRPASVPQDKKFKDLTEAERIEWNKRDPQGFKEAADAARRVV